jgi:hypothetical protein
MQSSALWFCFRALFWRRKYAADCYSNDATMWYRFQLGPSVKSRHKRSTYHQCCGIRCLYNPWTLDPE